jgi:hypothetical protein
MFTLSPTGIFISVGASLVNARHTRLTQRQTVDLDTLGRVSPTTNKKLPQPKKRNATNNCNIGGSAIDLEVLFLKLFCSNPAMYNTPSLVNLYLAYNSLSVKYSKGFSRSLNTLSLLIALA